MTTENQKIEQFWETPTHEEIIQISHAHVQALENGKEDAVWQQVGMQHIDQVLMFSVIQF